MKPITNEQTSANDVDLMQAASEGDHAALGHLYDRHAQLIFNVLMQKLADASEAQDIVQDVFVKIYNKRATYNPMLGKPVAWMLTIARNAATDKLRRRTTHQKYVNRAVHEVEQSSPAHNGPHLDEIELLNHCMGTLTDPQRNTLKLAYFGGLSQQEISDELTQPLGTVKAWIRRGMLKLKDCVEGKL
jgi:RNA polymerase sigma-70 factor, ECF subfamily